MIRNVVIHVSNEQPLLADLYSVPSPADVGLVCTNIRTMDGKKPIFIDHTDSTFFFPNLHIRFLEITNAEMVKHLATAGTAPGFDAGYAASSGASAPAASEEAATLDPDQRLPIALGRGSAAFDAEAEGPPDGDADIDIDEDFLQRIRDI